MWLVLTNCLLPVSDGLNLLCTKGKLAANTLLHRPTSKKMSLMSPALDSFSGVHGMTLWRAIFATLSYHTPSLSFYNPFFLHLSIQVTHRPSGNTFFVISSHVYNKEEPNSCMSYYCIDDISFLLTIYQKKNTPLLWFMLSLFREYPLAQDKTWGLDLHVSPHLISNTVTIT